MRHGGTLIFWIIILFPDLQNCAAIFVRKQTGNAAPPSRIYFKLRLYMQRKKKRGRKYRQRQHEKQKLEMK